MSEKKELKREEASAVSGGAEECRAQNSFTVNLPTELDCGNFAVVSRRCCGNVTVSDGRKSVNGTSMLGLVSMDRTKPLFVTLSDSRDYPEFASFR